MVILVKISKIVKFIMIIILFYFLLTIFLFVYCPTVAFATGPEEFIDHYGNVEYVGRDPYGYYHDPAITKKGENTMGTSIDVSKTQDNYGTKPPYEKDWYEGKKLSSYMFRDNHGYPYNSYSLYDKFRIKLHWYSWKKYSSEYKSFAQFKSSWNPSNSLRKEIKGLFVGKK